jgi:hypothetical protein
VSADAVFEQAGQDDVEELLGLYRTVYGSSYALPLGTDPRVMAAQIAEPNTTWLVGRVPGTRQLVGSILATIDPADRLGKLQGLVVHPDRRGGGIADQAVAVLSEAVLTGDRPVDSVYGTARTTSTAPQRICLRNGFRALGIFPNQRKASRHETMMLLVRYREGVAERRHPVQRIPAELDRFATAVDGAMGTRTHSERITDLPVPDDLLPAAPVEVVDAPVFVLRRFNEVVTDPARRFYPFHTPNLLIAAKDGQYEVYAHLSRSDGYCTLIGVAPNALAVAGHIGGLITQLAAFGASYLETLVPMDSYQELRALLAHGFFPAAAYPAMRRDGDGYRDYVLMARTMQPLDFQGLAIDAAFRPFVEQYIDLWKHKYLDTSGVFR